MNKTVEKMLLATMLKHQMSINNIIIDYATISEFNDKLEVKLSEEESRNSFIVWVNPKDKEVDMDNFEIQLYVWTDEGPIVWYEYPLEDDVACEMME